MCDSTKYVDLECAYGPPFIHMGESSLQINQSFFAGLLAKEYQLRFIGKTWWEYIEKCWRMVSRVQIAKLITDLLCRLAREYDLPLQLLRTNSNILASIEKIAQTIAYISEFPQMDWRLIPCRNAVLRWNEDNKEFEQVIHSSAQNIRSLLTIDYNREAGYGEFKKLVLDEVLEPDDAHLLQQYLGIALMPINLTENFLLLQGVGGSSKSLLVRLLVEILGDQRVFDLNIKALGQDYELSGLDFQTVLVASENAGDALCSSGAPFIKKMVGGDKIQTRLKYINEKRQLCGNYSLIIVSNEQTSFHYEGSGEEWRRRLLPVFFSKPHKKVIKGLVHHLLEQHGSGILNWLLEGAAEVLRNDWKIKLTPEQEYRRDRLIARSEPLRLFVEKFIQPSVGDDFTSEEAFELYCKTCQRENLPILSRETFFKQFFEKMSEVFPGVVVNNNIRRNSAGREKKTCRGYRGYQLKEIARV